MEMIIGAACGLPGLAIVAYLLWLHDRERERSRQSMMTTQARLVALADKVALSVADTQTDAARGTVSYMDEEKEVELYGPQAT